MNNESDVPGAYDSLDSTAAQMDLAPKESRFSQEVELWELISPGLRIDLRDCSSSKSVPN